MINISNLYRSTIIGSSPNKISNKGMSKGGKSAGSPGSAALVSDIGIVKKGGAKGSSSGGNSSSNNDANANSPGLVLEDSFEKYYNKDLDLEED